MKKILINGVGFQRHTFERLTQEQIAEAWAAGEATASIARRAGIAESTLRWYIGVAGLTKRRKGGQQISHHKRYNKLK